MSGKLYAVDSVGIKKWETPFNFGAQAGAGPTLIGDDGTIYFGGDNYNIYAVNPDGTQKWSYATGGAVKQGVAMSADGSTIYATSVDGRVYAISSNGALRWKSSILSASTSCTIGPDGSVYVGASNGKFYALNPDGTVRWSFQADAKITSAPALGLDGNVYFGSQDANLYALNPDGTQKWFYRSSGVIYSAPTIDGQGTVLFGSYSGSLIALNSEDGSALWTKAVGTAIYTSPVISYEPGLGSIYVLDNAGVLTKYSGLVTAPAETPEPCTIIALVFGLSSAALLRKRKA
jgi:outer membrane protein assembly factor BamB